MYIYRISVAVLSFFSARLRAAAEQQAKLADKATAEIKELEKKASAFKKDANKADVLAYKIDQLVK